VKRTTKFTLEGLSFIPKCGVNLTFRKGFVSKGWYWEFDYWKQGEEKTFSTPAGQLTFDPDYIDMSISFPGTSYKHNVTLNIKR